MADIVVNKNIIFVSGDTLVTRIAVILDINWQPPYLNMTINEPSDCIFITDIIIDISY